MSRRFVARLRAGDIRGAPNNSRIVVARSAFVAARDHSDSCNVTNLEAAMAGAQACIRRRFATHILTARYMDAARVVRGASRECGR